MLRRLLVSGALIASALVAPAVGAAPAGAVSLSAASSTTAAASCYKRVGNHWNCITPGAYCPAAAHGKYGYAKVTKRRYKCSYYSSDGRWHWKRAY
ncbi:hypothetical protein GCM10009530_64080 [Microbispora corallina]|uniref:Uncharacterized protein n=1 Tax=Microbispora corallina TaxID=83302 RepID=A0ABQ4GCN1_9ACTN|nr:hypothetical protein [Microbispora corallina]GIH44790.1 hypothetical protein Mco01_77900 [Microbispora corallina]